MNGEKQQSRVVLPSPGMRWVYQRTAAPVTIVRVKPKRGWPHHTLRAVFNGESAFTFHCDMLEVYFRQVPDATTLAEGRG